MERKSAKPIFQVVLNTHRLKSNDIVNKKTIIIFLMLTVLYTKITFLFCDEILKQTFDCF